MMKSFFKKLAFVMALAMVVSLAAPAGSAFAAETLNMTVQGTRDVITEYRLEKVGDTVDFQFWKAPADWKTDFVWASDNEAVATVDQNGLVTAVAEGTANVTVTVLGSYVGAVKVLVGEEKVELAYEVVQVNHNTVDFVFNKNVDYARGDVTLTKMYGDYPINWPVDFFSCKDNKVTISTYVEFADGDEYIIQIGAEDEGTKFTTTIGAVDEIKVTWKSKGLATTDDGKAYAPLSEDDDEIPVWLEHKLYSNGVDVTNAAKYKDGEISYSLGEANDKVDFDEEDGKAYLLFEDYTAAYAVVVPSFTYEGAEDDVTFTGEAVVIGATPVPAYGLDSVAAWSIVKKGDEKITWNKVNAEAGFPLEDELTKEHTLVVLVKDKLDKYYAFPTEAISNLKDGGKDASKYKYNGNDVYLFEDIEKEEAEDYRLEFKSTNDNTLFVGNDDGSITSIIDKKTSVLVSLYDTNDDDEEYLVRHMAVLTVKITEKRAVDKIKATVGFNSLPFKVNEEYALGTEAKDKLTGGKVTFKVVDQYGDPIPVSASNIEIKTSYDKDGFSDSLKTVSAKAGDNTGEFYVWFDAEDFTYTKKGKEEVASSVKYTVKVKNTDAKDEFTVKVEEPKYNDNGTIKVEEYKASASSINQTIADSSKLGDLTKTITVNEYSNDLNVGVKKNITLVTKNMKAPNGDGEMVDMLKNGKYELTLTSAMAEKGEVFVVVYGPNGEALDSSKISGSNGKYTFTAATEERVSVGASGSAISVMAYEDTGDYTVKVYTIDRRYDNKFSKCDIETTTFTVSRSNPVVSFAERDDVDLTQSGPIDIYELIEEAFNFNYAGAMLEDAQEANLVFTNPKYRYNEDAGRVYVYSVDVYAPLKKDGDSVYFNAGTVTINKYVEVDELAE